MSLWNKKSDRCAPTDSTCNLSLTGRKLERPKLQNIPMPLEVAKRLAAILPDHLRPGFMTFAGHDKNAFLDRVVVRDLTEDEIRAAREVVAEALRVSPFVEHAISDASMLEVYGKIYGKGQNESR